MVSQGNVINIHNIEFPCLVISKNTYNESNHVIVCPILNRADSLLSYHIDIGAVTGYVQCDNVKMMDLSVRSYFTKGSVSMSDLVFVLSMTTSIFDLV